LAEFYESIYGPIKEDLPFWTKAIEGYDEVLELACGTGRVTLELAKSGKKITALDYSEEMIDILRDKIRKEKVRNIDVVLGDMRSFELHKKFDAILITSNSLNHIETISDLKNCFESIMKHLKKDGVLVFDILNPHFKFLQRNTKETYDHRVFKNISNGMKFKMWENSEYEPSSQINYVNYFYQYLDNQEKGEGKIIESKIKVRIFYPQEMDLFLNLLGMKFKKFDWYDCNRWSGKGFEQIYIVKKNEE
jgi:ubiquinone/menaquinone biosynthesis C-methylase UbiE